MASSKYCHQKSISFMHSKTRERRVDRKVNKLKEEMKEISKQQECIKQGQKEMRQRFEEIESGCEHLKKETELISDASDNIQCRLDIMLQIVKAREENDFDAAAHLTCSLRDLSKGD